MQGLGSTYREPLQSVLFNTFEVNFEKNTQYNISFSAYDDGSVAFNMLQPEASVFWLGQEFIVKQPVPDYTAGVNVIQLTATHVGYEAGRVRQRSVKAGELTYSVNDVLNFIFSGNKLGFVWQVIGNFGNQQITDLGNCSGTDAISTIISTWPDAIFWPDNKNLRIYSHDALAKNLGKRIAYLHNTKEIQISFDSTAIVNQVMCYGKTKDNSDSDLPQYYFTPFIVENSASIAKWGVHPGDDISDERFTDATSMKNYALSQMASEPTMSITATDDTNEAPQMCEIRQLEIRPIGYITSVEVVAYQYYPLDPTQATTLTLNNSAQTILQYQRNAKTQLQKSVNSALSRYTATVNEKVTSLVNNTTVTNKAAQDEISNFVGGAE